MIDPSILSGFLPWIVFFAIGSSFFGLKMGVLIALVFQKSLSSFRWPERGNTPSLKPSALSYFIILAIAFFILSEQNIERLTKWSAAFSYGGLAFIAWASIAMGDPFTRQYARRSEPKEYWKSDLFLSFTMSMALGWSVAFLGGTVFSVIGALLGLSWFFIHGLAVGCMVLAILWHKRIMDDTQAKARQLQKTNQDGL